MYLNLLISFMPRHDTLMIPPTSLLNIGRRADLNKFCNQFRKDGFVAFPDPFLSSEIVANLNDRIEHVLRGTYDRGVPPDKAPKLIEAELESAESKIGPLGFSGRLQQNCKVLQVINIHKCDHAFRSLATNAFLGELISKLAGWEEGVRLASDQTWLKPPGGQPLTFHRDSPYFMFTPSDVVTVWIALDDMSEELGPLEYVTGSHLWGEGRIGTSKNFFQKNGGKALVYSAAEREGIQIEDLEFVSMKNLCAGGLSIHDGRTWHGSKGNVSTSKPRRGIGLHYVPANVRFTQSASKSSLWRRYIEGKHDVSNIQVCDEDFPTVWVPNSPS